MDAEQTQGSLTDHSEVIAKLLYEKMKREEEEKSYASTKQVLTILGMGATIGAAFIAPNTARHLIKTFWHQEGEWEDWKKFNIGYLRQTLRRLEKKKLIEVKFVDGKEQIVISTAGKKKVLQYAIEELQILKPDKWDGKWRLVLYDIPSKHKRTQEAMRKELKRLGFLAIHESVYVTPYPCEDEIEFLRQHFELGKYIKFMLVERLEDDSAYKQYFGLS